MRSTAVTLLFLLPNLLSAADRTVVLVPDKPRVVPLGQEKVTGKPKIGDRRFFKKVTGVRVGILDDERSGEEKSTNLGLSAKRTKRGLTLLASSGGAGRRYKVRMSYTSRVREYRVTKNVGIKLKKGWVEIDPISGVDEIIVLVALTETPYALLSIEDSLNIELPEWLENVKFNRTHTACAKLMVGEQNSLEIRPVKVGDARFPFSYKLEGQRFKSRIPVRITDKRFELAITIDGKDRHEIPVAKIDELLSMENGRIVRLEQDKKSNVATFAHDAAKVTVKPGKTRKILRSTGKVKTDQIGGQVTAVVTYEGREMKLHKPKNFVVKVALLITIDAKPR